jgi:hypothetical protein
MGEHADYALNETIDFESQFAENYYELDDTFSREYPDREPHPLFDYDGIPTYETLSSGIRNCAVMLSSNMSLAEYAGYSLNDHIEGIVELPELKVKAFKAKHKVKYNMMFGMINTLYEGGTLSAKQAKWMETNWKGGTQKLIFDMLDPNEARVIMDKISKITEWINDN